jgi:Sulfatase-modifying factor enzyme 1
MAEFTDSTGRSGPASWKFGNYEEGRDEFPVNGVSWYEAAAYAEFAGKSLPTTHHWNPRRGPKRFSRTWLNLAISISAAPRRLAAIPASVSWELTTWPVTSASGPRQRLGSGAISSAEDGSIRAPYPAPRDKRHVLLNSGHMPAPFGDLVREVTTWLDHYPGPVGAANRRGQQEGRYNVAMSLVVVGSVT